MLGRTRSGIRRATTTLFVIGVHLVAGSTAFAQAQMEFIPSMSVFTVHDDNIFARVDSTAGQMLQLKFVTPVRVSDVSCIRRATPKSTSLISSKRLSRRRMFDGLMSRWTTPSS